MTARTNDEIRASVSKAYASRVRPVLDRVELAAPTEGAACCGPECCSTGDAAASDVIALIDVTPASDSAACCGTDSDPLDISNIARLYAASDTTDLPATVTDIAFGCGNPTAIAAMQPGEVVLDLGSGGGIDCFLAAKMVGETGRVYGVDMTPEMIALARANAAKLGASNVEFRLGEIEHLPLADASIDVIISNCVINLAPDKDQVFREAFRVLRPGGRLQVSDMVWTKAAPDELKHDMEQWAGCVAGALLEADYLAKIEAAGFSDVTSVSSEYDGGHGIASANVVAFKR
jgi:arsenite methyltransferase